MTRRPARALAAVAPLLVAVALAGCGGGGTTTTTGATTTTSGATALRCPATPVRTRTDPAGDVRAQSVDGPDRAASQPSADLRAVSVRRGAGDVVCVTFRTAGPVREGSSFSLTLRRGGAGGRPPDEQRYEIQLAPGRPPQVSRPHGEPRYPVTARVRRRGDTLAVALLAAPVPGASWYAWRADVTYLPRFPLGDQFVDAAPDGTEWEPAP